MRLRSARGSVQGIWSFVRDQHAPFLNSLVVTTLKLFGPRRTTVLSGLLEVLREEAVLVVLLEHFKVVRALKRSGARVLIRRFPHYVNKYVHPYMASGFDREVRRTIVKFHHQYLAERLAESFYEKILRRPPLWSEVINGHVYAICISFDEAHHREGDISLTFNKNGVIIYDAAFTMVPGLVIDNSAECVLLVGRIQGRKNRAGDIAIATRACHNIAPPRLLMQTVQSIAAELSINTIAGVNNEAQLARSYKGGSQVVFDYDAFWEAFKWERKTPIAFEFRVPIPPKREGNPSQRNRRRLQKQIELKNRISSTVRATFAAEFLTTPPARQFGRMPSSVKVSKGALYSAATRANGR